MRSQPIVLRLFCLVVVIVVVIAVIVQLGTKLNTKIGLNHHPPPPPTTTTRNFSKGREGPRGPKFGM